MKKLIAFIMITIMCCQLVIAQSGTTSNATISGSVYELDANQKRTPLPFANIHWAGTNKGTVANDKGEFTLIKDKKSNKLVASFVGFANDTLNTTKLGTIENGTLESSTHETSTNQTSAIETSTNDVMDSDAKVSSANESTAITNNRVEFVLLKGAQLSQVEVKDKLNGSYISLIKPIKTEVITTAGLQKLACCNLSESFANNATVDVGFSDAVTGARQIQMLGLAGVYSQLMVENIPFTRGLGSAFGLTYIPGTWMESIQISKGTSSVINGYESTTGQINAEIRKPWNSDKLFMNVYLNNEGRYEVNAHASTKVNDKLSTMVLAHTSSQVLKSDMNHDGFLDLPLSQQINLSNRWSYNKPGVTESKFGINFLNDERSGGQLLNMKTDEAVADGRYVMKVLTRRAQVYDKTGFMFKNKPNTSLGLIFSGLYHDQESMFGSKEYNARQLGFYGNAIFQSGSPVHGYSTGVSLMYDNYDEQYADSSFSRVESVPGVFAQYSYIPNPKLNITAGMRVDYHNLHGIMYTPRVHFKVNLLPTTILRASAGKGYRSPSILAENTGLLVSSRQLVFREDFKLEEAWNYGINVTQEFNISSSRKGTLTVDFYRTDFINQVIVDLDDAFNKVIFYNLDGKSYSNSFQVDLSANILKGFDITAAYRLNDTKVTTAGQLRERPLVSRNKGLLTMSYATRFDKWKFDFTSQYNGQTRLPLGLHAHGSDESLTVSPGYFTIHTQVTRKFKKWDVYAGVENLTNFKQMNPVLGYETPFAEGFDAGMVWGPIVGRMFYGGIRFVIPSK